MATATQGPEVRRVSTTPRLHGERLELLLAGIAPLLLGLAGLIVLEGPADRPELNQPPAVILSYFGEQDTVILGSFLLMLAAVASSGSRARCGSSSAGRRAVKAASAPSPSAAAWRRACSCWRGRR